MGPRSTRRNKVLACTWRLGDATVVGRTSPGRIPQHVVASQRTDMPEVIGRNTGCIEYSSRRYVVRRLRVGTKEFRQLRRSCTPRGSKAVAPAITLRVSSSSFRGRLRKAPARSRGCILSILHVRTDTPAATAHFSHIRKTRGSSGVTRCTILHRKYSRRNNSINCSQLQLHRELPNELETSTLCIQS